MGLVLASAVLPGPGAYADEALRFRQAGWTAYKIHPPTRPEEDITVCAAVRDAVGDDYRLMLDATWSYRYDQALRSRRSASTGTRTRSRTMICSAACGCARSSTSR
jgi:L-alanine-DL-glutamate epimerase-like enolase superfamily enzyme